MADDGYMGRYYIIQTDDKINHFLAWLQQGIEMKGNRPNF